MSFPKIIHQTWKTEKIPKNMGEWQKSWKTNHPGWEYKLWTDKTCRELVESKYPQYLKLYNSFEQNIQRVDFWKYLVLHAYGGVYADLDTQSLKSLDPLVDEGMKYARGKTPSSHLLKKSRLRLGPESKIPKRFIILGETGDMIECSFMISTPRHPFWLKLCDYIDYEYAHQTLMVQGISLFSTIGVLWTTGPFALTEFINANNNSSSPTKSKGKNKKEWNVIIKPENYFSPMSWINVETESSIFPSGKKWPKESYVVHHFADTWQNGWEKKISSLVRDHWGIMILILVIIVVLVIFLVWYFWRR